MNMIKFVWVNLEVSDVGHEATEIFEIEIELKVDFTRSLGFFFADGLPRPSGLNILNFFSIWGWIF